MKITIPTPCHEDWENMTLQDKGRFCESCQKIVIDFTKMTNDEIIDYFKNQENKKSTCGQFYDKQLLQINQEDNQQDITQDFFIKKLFQKTVFWVSTFLFFNHSQNTFAQKENQQQLAPQKNLNAVTENELKNIEEPLKSIERFPTRKTALLEGIVTDELTKEPLIQATVVVKGTIIGTITDENGKFQLEAMNNCILVVSCAGYFTQEMKVGKEKEVNFILKPDDNDIEIVRMGGYCIVERPNIFLRTWRGIKSIFRRRK